MIPDVDLIDDAVLDAIAAVDADILCVALGNPKQERFIAAHRDRLQVPVMIGVGGSLDMLVGKRRRAPEWMQSLGLEWVVRAIQEPRRLGLRYAHDIRVFTPAIVCRHGWRAAAGDTGPGCVVVPADGRRIELLLDGDDVLTLARVAVGRVDRASVGRRADRRQRTSARRATVALAQLVGLIRVAARSGTRVEWNTVDGLPPGWLETFGMSPAAVTSAGP